MNSVFVFVPFFGISLGSGLAFCVNLVVNPKTAKALGIKIPPQNMVRADPVIE